MTARDYLFYGLGMVAHSVAKADGKIQEEEKRELHDLITQWAEQFDEGYDITEIIFRVLKDQQPDYQEGYQQGLKYIRLGDNHLTEGLKEKFVFLIRDVARAFPPVTMEEKNMIERFKKDLDAH